jgi:hypothetical protein
MKNTPGLKAWLLVLVLFVLPYFLLLSYFSYFGKDVVYLRGGGPPWMQNPEDSPVANGFPHDFPATYATSFNLGAPPVKGYLEINAVKSYVLSVNGAKLTTEEETVKRNWKSASRHDIAPYLRQGENSINIYVRSPYSITALKVRGEAVGADGAGVSLDSGDSWAVASVKPFPPLGIVGNTWNQVEVVAHESFMDRLRSGQYWPGSLFIFSGAALLILALLLLPGMSRAVDGFLLIFIPESLRGQKARKKLFNASVIAIFTVLGFVLFNNFLKYPAARTGDTQFHMEYLNHFLESWRIPLASEGFQMYNPPAFYLISAFLYRLAGPGGTFDGVERYAQLINTVSALLTVLVVFLALKRLIRDRGVLLLTLLVAAFLPINIYKAPSISAENMTALICTTAIFFWVRYIEKPGIKPVLLMGLFTGIGFLTRYTTLMVAIGVTAGFIYIALIRDRDIKTILREYGLYVLVTGAVSGWYYVRNLVHFHKLFPFNGSPDLFFFRQVPGYHDWNFYSDIGGILINNPLSKNTLMESFPGGFYSTFWYDGHRLFVTTHDFVLIFVLLALALLPTLLIIWGIQQSCAGAFSGTRDRDQAFAVGSAVTVALSFTAAMLLGLRMPFYSSTKAFYILYCILPLTYFLGVGLNAWVGRRGYVTAALWTAAFCLAALKVFFL